jgi:hypothetical protein
MADIEALIPQGLLAVTYIFLTLQKRNGMWLVSAALFLLTATYIRYSLDVYSLHDFRPYFESFLAVKGGTYETSILFEPYRLLLFKSVLLLGNLDDKTQINIVYWFHFLIVTGFFLWLAYLKEVTFEAKLFIFLAFYPTIAFVWIRAGMAYVVSCYLFFTITNGKYRVLHFLTPLFHAGVIPLVIAMKIKDLKPARKALIILLAAIVVFLALESSYVQYLIYKLEYYSDTAGNRSSINLLLFHVANILVFVYLALINSKFRKNFAVNMLMGAYLAFYFVSPIIGLRIFPLVLIACIAQRISFPRYQLLTLLVCLAYLPIYFGRFDQILI